MTPYSPHDDAPWELLARYVAGELPAAEAEDVRRWLAAGRGRAELLGQVEQLWREAPALRQDWDAEAALLRIKQPVEVGPAQVIQLPAFYRDEPLTARIRRMVLRAAAAIVLVAGGSWAARHYFIAENNEIASSEVRTPRGQRASLHLPDGSEVMLGPGSRLRYAIAPTRGPRTVELDGEAYFTVTHNEARPFSVHTAHGIATDLGTRFSVRAHTADTLTEVVVAEGEVALGRTADAPIVLMRGDVGQLTARGRLTMERSADVASRLAWTEGRLEFRDTPLRDAVLQLGRWYDLNVWLADTSLGGRRLTASFKHESSAEALRLITESLELTMVRRADTVRLESK